MAQSVIHHWALGDASPIGPLQPVDVINDISHLFGLHQADTDEAILDSSGDYPLCDEDGNDIEASPLCSCGHAIDEHQTGEGPWTGFCFDPDCKCEQPREVVWAGDIKEVK